MPKNVYDVYMDDHWGVNTWQASGSAAGYFGAPGPTDLAAMALGLYKDGAALLTRREPEGSLPTLYQRTGVEEFSVFFALPVSQQVTQVFSTGSEQFRLQELGLPTFCDWDFCDLNGWRSGVNSSTSLLGPSGMKLRPSSPPAPPQVEERGEAPRAGRLWLLHARLSRAGHARRGAGRGGVIRERARARCFSVLYFAEVLEVGVHTKA